MHVVRRSNPDTMTASVTYSLTGSYKYNFISNEVLKSFPFLPFQILSSVEMLLFSVSGQ